MARDVIPNVEARHHTEAQIAAKKAKEARTKAGARDIVESREPHHTEAQIARKKAKEEKAKASARDVVESCEPHHTEAQIAEKRPRLLRKPVPTKFLRKRTLFTRYGA